MELTLTTLPTHWQGIRLGLAAFKFLIMTHLCPCERPPFETPRAHLEPTPTMSRHLGHIHKSDNKQVCHCHFGHSISRLSVVPLHWHGRIESAYKVATCPFLQTRPRKWTRMDAERTPSDTAVLSTNAHTNYTLSQSSMVESEPAGCEARVTRPMMRTATSSPAK